MFARTKIIPVKFTDITAAKVLGLFSIIFHQSFLNWSFKNYKRLFTFIKYKFEAKSFLPVFKANEYQGKIWPTAPLRNDSTRNSKHKQISELQMQIVQCK